MMHRFDPHCFVRRQVGGTTQRTEVSDSCLTSSAAVPAIPDATVTAGQPSDNDTVIYTCLKRYLARELFPLLAANRLLATTVAQPAAL
ncbi:MAG: hypothetical protein M3069_19470 [Chloroflexota bacterium]|nr:hypothetical protein [Chloroflexota bacterium]